MKRVVVVVLFLSNFFVTFAQYTERDIRNYIEQYQELAIRKMYEYQIPASITMAQGVFESACGTSRLAREGNNHFGIKCHKEWVGDTIKVDDDTLQECFRRYEKVEDSYNDHSLFLTSRPRYANLFTLDIMDYRGWARGLKEAGYATNPQYADRLISLIERFDLARLDTLYQERNEIGWFELHQVEVEDEIEEDNDSDEVLDQEEIRVSRFTVFIPRISKYKKVKYPFSTRPVYENNKVLFVVAKKGDTYASIAADIQSDEQRIRYYNDVPVTKGLEPGEIVYIEQKRDGNNQATHRVNSGETLHFISQRYGVRIASLMKLNSFSEKTVLEPGMIVNLKKEKFRLFKK